MLGKIKAKISYFTKLEVTLWLCSCALIVISWLMFSKSGALSLAASLIGVTSLIFNAKGNPIGQLLMIIFSLLYGIISFSFSYYGEMLTYLGMTMPMAAFALISWVKNPYNGNKAEVAVNNIKKTEFIFMWALAAVITVLFYFVLSAFNTANIILSTISVTTSFVSVYLTFRRSPLYAIGYAANDVVLIALWLLATLENTEYFSVAVCFMVFLVNDIYGYVSWKKIGQRQAKQL